MRTYARSRRPGPRIGASIAAGLLGAMLAVGGGSGGARAAAEAPEHDRAYYESRGDVVWEVPGRERMMALTFDDGPDPKTTPRILDLLKQYDAKATFFAIGAKLREHPEIGRREAAEGHELANHTFTHRFLGACSSRQIESEIALTQRTIFEVTGQLPRLFRPPGGVFNGKVLEEVKRERLQTVLWSWHQDTRDWARPGVGRIVRKVVGNARSGDIVLLHDAVQGSNQTVEALKVILPELQKMGYRFVTVSELIGQTRPVSPDRRPNGI